VVSRSSRVESQWTTPGRYQRAKKEVPQEAIAEILSAIDLRDLVSDSSVHINRDEGSDTGKADCPFHGGGERRTLNIDKQRFQCSVCDFKGSALGWLMYHDGMGFFESLEHLAIKTGVDNEAKPTGEQLSSDQSFKHEHLRRACSAYERTLAEYQPAQHYLQQREMTHASIKKFRLGWASESADELLDGNMRNHRSLWQVGMLFRQSDGGYRPRFRKRIMIPIRDRNGNVLGFGARDISESGNSTSKYINSPSSPVFNKSKILYGLYEAYNAIQEQDRIFLVEGYMDVILASQAGVCNVVATLGTSITEQHLRTALSNASHLTLCLDADGAGQRQTIPALLRALSVAEESHTVDVLTLPSGMDPDDYFRAHTIDEFHALAGTATPIENALFANFDKLDNTSIGEMARVGVYAADAIVDTLAPGLAARIQSYAESLLRISLDAEIERAKERQSSKR